MRILFVCNNYKPSWEAGGEVRFVYDLAQALLRNGHQVTVFTNNYYKKDYGVKINVPVDVDGVTVFYFDNLMKRFPAIAVSPLPLCIPKSALDTISDYDMIHIHGHRSMLEWVVARKAYRLSVPFIIQAHGSALHHNMRLLKTIFDRIIGDRILREASTIVISTANERKEYQYIRAPPNFFEIAANGIDLSLFSPSPEDGGFRKKIGIGDEDTLVLFMGRINEIKSLEMLIESHSVLIKEIPYMKLAIVGPVDDSKYYRRLQDLVEVYETSKSVFFCGPLYGVEKAQAYVDADIYVQPSKYESFSNTIVEALAAGTPVVMSKHCNIADKMQDMGIASDHRPESFTEAIRKLALDPALRKHYGDNGKFTMPHKYGLDKVVQDYIDIYNRVLQRK